MKAGLFDMNVIEPIVGEDYDLAIRIQKAGFKIVSSNKVRALHYTRHVYKRTLLAIERGPKWWEKLVQNESYFFAKNYDLLGFAVIIHAFYNAFISPLALIIRLIRLKKHLQPMFFIKIYLRSIKGSFQGLFKGLMNIQRHK
jgi:GT2 family glycosyltransferase